MFYHRNKVENWQKAVRLSEVGAVDMPSEARLDIFAGNAAKSIYFRDAKARYDTYALQCESICIVGSDGIARFANRLTVCLRSDDVAMVSICRARLGSIFSREMPRNRYAFAMRKLDMLQMAQILSLSVTMVNEKEVSFWADFLFVYHSQGTVGVSPAEAVIISCAAVISIEGA